MTIEWKKSTNKGTAFLKLVHQFQQTVLFTDPYIRWFFDRSEIESAKNTFPESLIRSKNEKEQFEFLAYWYVVFREKHGDRAIETAIESGCKQLLLLGAGYDTRFFRLAKIQENSVQTFEIDLPNTIEEKKRCLSAQLDVLPQGLSLIPLDLNRDNLNHLHEFGFEDRVPTIYIWQGVSYYLEQERVSTTLDSIKRQMIPGSVFVFDCCSPLMTFKNDRIPGINTNIEQLAKIGEPYRFGMYADDMEQWLNEKGFDKIEILQLNDLEEGFLNTRTFPESLWYIVTVKT